MPSLRNKFALALVALTAAPLAVAAGARGGVGPANHETMNGHLLHPAGRVTQVGNFPTGGALTPDGRFYWAVATGRGLNDLRAVSTATGKVVQTIPIPGASGGIVMNPRTHEVYVSGVADSNHKDQQRLTLPGRDGDVIHVYEYDPVRGTARFRKLISVKPPTATPPAQTFPPTSTKPQAWPAHLAVTPDGKRLLVPLNLADAAAVVDVATSAVTTVRVGRYPWGAAVLRDGKTGLVSNEADGTVSVIDLTSGSKTADITVAGHLSHPEGLLADPKADRAYVAVANTDDVVVLDTKARSVIGRVSLKRAGRLGASPVSLALDSSHHRLYVTEEGLDDLAVLDVSAATPRVVGHVPTASFPTDVAVGGGKLVWLSGRHLGVGPNRNGPNPTSPKNSDDGINSFSYLPSIVRGSVGVLALPSARTLATMTKTALAQGVPNDGEPAPAGTPLRPDGPIKHVFYIVRENRTYDQILGDLGRGESDPSLSLFGKKVTPNAHALASRFPLLDHVFANSEASIDGHFWTSAAGVSDYVQRNWWQNYAGRGRPYDFGVYSVTWPGNGFLFDQAQRQGISYFNYGEAIAGTVPLTDRDREFAGTQAVATKFAHSDLGLGTRTGLGATPAGQCYPNDADIETNAITQAPTYDGTPPAGAPQNAESRFDCFKARFDAQVASDTVPAFNYLVLPNDHTVGTTPGKRTPQALVADNDYGLGQMVDAISHSSIWSSSAIFAVEDDSQDGADHVDAHRIPAFVISPYARNALVPHRYDFLSVIKSMELILGMEPLGVGDAVATPMYDAFASSPVNSAPYTAIVPQQSRSVLNTALSPDAALSASLNFGDLDRVPQHELDMILWHAVYGPDATPPSPGPNAEGAGARDGDD